MAGKVNARCTDSVQLALRILGGLTSLVFALQSIWIFMKPPTPGFWRLCHWFGQALLCVFAGGAGCFLEYKGHQSLGLGLKQKYFLNRLLLAFFYFWLGCYIVDMSNNGVWQEVLAHVTGIVAWAVSAGNFILNCTLRGTNSGAEAHELKIGTNMGHPAEVAATRPQPKATAPPSDVDLEANQAADAPASGWNGTWSHKTRDGIDSVSAPDGGWNNSFNHRLGE